MKQSIQLPKILLTRQTEVINTMTPQDMKVDLKNPIQHSWQRRMEWSLFRHQTRHSEKKKQLNIGRLRTD